MKIAVTGASGYIGNRVVEKFYLGDIHEVVPLVRSNSSLALPARFNLPWKVCDHSSIEDLSKAFEGCETVIHAAYGSPLGSMSKAVYLAADTVGVRRLMVLSSASVYNQNPVLGITEESPLPDKAATPYNASKISSDKIFHRLRSKGKTEIVFLMPGIVYGPRSQWLMRVANQTMEGVVYLVGGGEGICNAIYVDNLVEAIRLSLTASGVDNESFFVSDSETVTWKDFYCPVLSAFGATLRDVYFVDEPPVFHVSMRERIRGRVEDVVQTKTIQSVKPFMSPKLKKIYKTAFSLALSNDDARADAWSPPEEKRPEVTLEMSLLHQCAYKLPNAKAERLLRYRPTVTFAEGISKSVSWLKFAGYPVVL